MPRQILTVQIFSSKHASEVQQCFNAWSSRRTEEEQATIKLTWSPTAQHVSSSGTYTERGDAWYILQVEYLREVDDVEPEDQSP